MFDYRSLTYPETEELFRSHRFAIRPMHHQLITLAHAVGEDLNRVCLFHDIGTGKTLTALWLLQLWQVRRILVVCPRSAFTSWKRDISNYTDFSYTVLEGEKNERIGKLENHSDIYIINYEGLKSIYCKLKKGKGWQIDLKSFVDDFDCIVFDEVHKCKAYDALQSKICFQLSARSSHAIGMTGTPIGQHLLEIWNVLKVVDLGDRLGPNFFSFRQNYFQRNVFYGRGGRPFDEWIPQPDAEERILRQIAPITTCFKRIECLDLPGKTYQTREIDMSLEQIDASNEILEKLALQLAEGHVTISNVLTRTQKLLQITGGFLYVRDSDERAVHRFSTNPKLEALSDIIEESCGKLIIFHQFEEEGHILETWARTKKLKYSSLRGETKNREGEYHRFVDDPSTRLMIAHPICASESLDMSISSVMVFYSNSYSLLQREQAEGRIWRRGQNQHCIYIDLVAKNSVDEIVIQRIDSKKELSNRVIEFIRNFRK